MEPAKGEKPRRSRLKALVVLLIIIVAAVAGACYYASISSIRPTPIAPSEFTLAVAPHAFPLSPGWGRNITIRIVRMQGFQQDINVSLVGNGPSWIYYRPTDIPSSQTNASMLIAIGRTAPKGSVELNVEAIAEGSANQFANLTMRVVGVLNVTRAGGNAQVYETTKVLDNETMTALTSYDNSTGTMKFSQTTPTLQELERGDVIVGQPGISKEARNGFLQIVLNIQQANGEVTLGTEQATVFELFRAAHIHKPFQLSKTSGSSGSLSVHSLSPDAAEVDDWNLGNGYTLGFDFSSSFGGDFDVDMSYAAEAVCLYALAQGGFWSGAACVMVASLIGQLNTLDLSLSASVTLDTWLKGPGGDIQWGPIDIFPDVLGPGGIVTPIFPPFLWLDTGGAIEALGQLHLHPTDIEFATTISAGPIGPHYDNNNGWSFHHDFSPPMITPVKTEGLEPGDYVRGEIGPRLDLSIDSGLSSGSVAVHAFIELKTSPNWPSGKPSITYPTSSTRIDLSTVNTAFGPGMGVGSWFANAPTPQGVHVSCMWMDDQLGQIGHSNQGDCNLDHADVPTASFLTWGIPVHHITVTATWTNLPTFELDGGICMREHISVLWGAKSWDFGPQDLITMPIWEGAPSGSVKSNPSDPVAVTFLFPVPTLEVLSPTQASCPTGQSNCVVISGAAVYASTPINWDATANVWTGQGYVDLCQSTPDNFAWFWGDSPLSYNPSIGGSFAGYLVTGQMLDTSCHSHSRFSLSTGPQTISIIYYLYKNGFMVAGEDNNGNPIYISIKLNVQPKPQGPPLTLQVVPVTGTYAAYGVACNGNCWSSVPFEAVISGGTSPYRANIILNSANVPDGHWLITSLTGIKGPIVAYSWDLQKNFCTLPFASPITYTVTVTMSVYDANNVAASGNTGQFTINCLRPAQEFPPVFDSATVALLMVLFAATAERKTIIEKELWPRTLRTANCQSFW